VGAVNGQVSLYTSAFGIGMPRTLESVKVLSWQPDQQTTLLFPLSQKVLNEPDQRIGVYVRIDHPYDLRFINNHGSQIISEAFTSVEGRTFSVPVPVMNQSPGPQQITLSTAYHKSLPSLTRSRGKERLEAGGEFPCVVPNPVIQSP
jgi:hypothetical protein